MSGQSGQWECAAPMKSVLLRGLIVSLLVLEVLGILVFAHYAGWKAVFYEAAATALLGFLLIVLLRYGWKDALFGDPVVVGQEDEPLRIAVRYGYLLLAGAVLLIFPGLLSDTVGLLLVGWALVGSLRQCALRARH
jgi:UPF0716 family protein affecting phage T7 exclusion